MVSKVKAVLAFTALAAAFALQEPLRAQESAQQDKMQSDTMKPDSMKQDDKMKEDKMSTDKMSDKKKKGKKDKKKKADKMDNMKDDKMGTRRTQAEKRAVLSGAVLVEPLLWRRSQAKKPSQRWRSRARAKEEKKRI